MAKKEIDSNDTNKELTAMMALSSKVNAAVVIKKYTEHFLDVDLMALMENLQSKHQKVKEDDFEKIEGMLLDQAAVLQAIFSKLALNSAQVSCVQQMETYLRLALKAQGQCAKTLATLHAIKCPSNISFIKQTNTGENVQVNNSLTTSQASQEKIVKSSNELLEEPYHDSRLDLRATNETIRTHPHLEAVR